MKNTTAWHSSKRNLPLAAAAAWGLAVGGAIANERRFTYSYEPETLSQGTAEFEQWITLGSGRTTGGTVQAENFNKWVFREELEYGLTDRYTVGLYLNTEAESYRDRSVNPAADVSEFKFEGIALENRYLLLNPAEHAVGVTLYLEPSFSGAEAELEEKLILGQRYGDWKWTVNLSHATEWQDNFHETVGELEATFGLVRDLSARWSLGLEFRNHNEVESYEDWEHSAFFLGPVVSYRAEGWWATLTVLPQIYGKNHNGNPDGNTHLVLDDHERVNLRFLLGISL
jgi:hypothetical protein